MLFYFIYNLFSGRKIVLVFNLFLFQRAVKRHAKPFLTNAFLDKYVLTFKKTMYCKSKKVEQLKAIVKFTKKKLLTNKC